MSLPRLRTLQVRLDGSASEWPPINCPALTSLTIGDSLRHLPLDHWPYPNLRKLVLSTLEGRKHSLLEDLTKLARLCPKLRTVAIDAVWCELQQEELEVLVSSLAACGVCKLTITVDTRKGTLCT